MYLHFSNFVLVFMIVGLVGEAVVIAEDFRPLIPPLFLSPDNTCYNISQPLFPSIGTPSWSCLQVSEVTSQYTVKTRISEPCAMKSRISFSGTEAKNTAKTQSLSPFRGRKKNKIFLTLLREESPTT